MNWMLVNRAHPTARLIADRHYNRQSIGSAQFAPPGRCIVLMTPTSSAAWITSYPFAKFVKHAWSGAWVNSLFRREHPDGVLASELIRSAISATRAVARTLDSWEDEPPPLGMVTFVDPKHVRRIPRREHRCAAGCRGACIVGYAYERAGFTHVGYTLGGLWTWQLLPDVMPTPIAPLREQTEIVWEAQRFPQGEDCRA